MDPFLSVERVEKRFGEVEVLRGVTLDAGEGEILALLGPSGSGKTTLLRLLAGFETPEAGRILLAGEDVTVQPAARRNVGMVFQHFALFPHLTVGENVGFCLVARRWRPPRVRDRITEMLALVDLVGLADRRTAELSGGQQQRVALARALAPAPRLLRLDEPLSNLDPALRERTRRELKQAIRRVGITTVFVTHEQEEAFDLGGRVAVLHGGRLDQVGTPEELYETPRTRFVAGFVGRSSALSGVVCRDGRVEVAPGALWPASVSGPDGAPRPGAAVHVLVRPEALELVAPDAAGALAGRVVERRFTGAATFCIVALEGGAEVEVLVAGRVPQEGARVAVVPRQQGPLPRVYPRDESA